LAHLVNRTDAWGGYYRDGQVTRRGLLSHPLVVRHCHARYAGDIVGVHMADADNRSKGGALDFDQKGDDSVRAAANRRAALYWYDVLVRMGFRPLLTTSNGKGGFHLRVLLAEPIDAARVFHFLRRLTADHRAVGLDKPPEQFPKQADVRTCAKGLGNWLRLPGKHHKYDHCSEVWNGSHWLAGDAAIGFILSHDGDNPALVPDTPPAVPVKKQRSGLVLRSGRRGDISARIAAYMRRLPHLGEGQGRDDVAFGFAAWLARDLALPDHIALPWLEAWDRGNDPPKGKDRLAVILQNARTYGQKQIGGAL
jgi:hypothetical protein